MNQPTRQMAPRASQEPRSRALVLTGASNDPLETSKMLAVANEHAHLVSPATSVAMLPEGCSVVLSQVLIDPSETYKAGDKLGLAKSALDRIAAGAGISWSPEQSGRLDDGSDPYYCAWRAVGTLRQLDGTEITIEGSKEMDLRNGSPQLEGLYERFESDRRNPRQGRAPAKDPTGQIREMRLHIMAHAESKARLRAIRSIGVRSAYTPKDLEKPFVVARLMFTGYSEDPGIRARFAELTAQAFLGGRRALYGGPSAGPLVSASRPAQSGAPRLSPPPIDRSRTDDDDDEFTRGAPQRQEPLRGQSTPGRGQPAREDVSAQSSDDDRERSGFTIPGGREKGVAIEEAGDESLSYWEQRITASLDEGTSRYPDKDRALVEALRAELGAREVVG